MSFSKVSLEVSLIEISAMFQSRKSLTYGLQIGIGLALGGSTLLATFPALATPDPIFEPMLEEISAAAVASNPIRLPASVPTDVALYPSVIQNFGMLILRLDTTPDCEASACLGMGIAIAAAPPYWPPEDEELTAVDLGQRHSGLCQCQRRVWLNTVDSRSPRFMPCHTKSMFFLQWRRSPWPLLW